ncbi:MAG TPA: NUDIX hydrolase [Chlamydiales bacterium]|nr:NUDIX hydrolase [Chlamydiales bacterium]
MLEIPKVKSSKILHDGYVVFREDLLEKSSGITQPMGSLLCRNATAILAQDSSGRWILNREYRHATGEIILGCPGGVLELNEDPIVGGKREFLEETGYWADEMVCLGCCFPFPGLCNQKIYHLFAKNAVKKGEPKLDAFEFIDTELVTDAELRKLILNGDSIDGILLTALSYISIHNCAPR